MRMCWSLPGTGFILLILHRLNPPIFRMMTPPIFHFSLILEEEDVVILLLRFASLILGSPRLLMTNST